MDNTKTAPETKQRISIAEQFRDTIASLVHNPFCNRPGCFGRGYLGVIKFKPDDGDFIDMLQFCKCAKIEETKLMQISSQITQLTAEMKNMAAANALFARRLVAQAEDLRMIYSHTFWGFPRTILANVALIARHWRKTVSEKLNRHAPSPLAWIEPPKF